MPRATNKGQFAKGPDPRRGRGRGVKGRSGRKPDAWKAMMRRLATRESTVRALKRVLRNPKHPAWLGALRFAAEYGFGKPAQDVTFGFGGVTLEYLVAASRDTDEDRRGLRHAQTAEVLRIEAPREMPVTTSDDMPGSAPGEALTRTACMP